MHGGSEECSAKDAMQREKYLALVQRKAHCAERQRARRRQQNRKSYARRRRKEKHRAAKEAKQDKEARRKANLRACDLAAALPAEKAQQDERARRGEMRDAASVGQSSGVCCGRAFGLPLECKNEIWRLENAYGTSLIKAMKRSEDSYSRVLHNLEHPSRGQIYRLMSSLGLMEQSHQTRKWLLSKWLMGI